MNNTYTFIMDYLGGTYISQVEAGDKEQAMGLWIQNLETKEIESFSKKDKEKIIKKGLINEEPVLLKGLQNVWCFTIRIKKGTALVNFVKTDKQ